MRSNFKLLSVLIVAAVLSCDTGPGTMNSDEEESVKIFFQDWIGRFMETRNPDDYFNGVSDNFTIMGCDFDPITSRDTIVAEITALAKSDVTVNIEDCQSHEVIIRDDIAIHRYSCFEVIGSSRDTSEIRTGFNFLDVLKKTDGGQWKIHLHLAIPKPGKVETAGTEVTAR